MNIVLPEIGETITSERAIELCKYFQLDYLVDRIQNNKDAYNSWIFDGVSGIPDSLASLFADCDQHKLTYYCALPHDLGYAYGEKNNLEEKKMVDVKFYHDMVHTAYADDFVADIFFAIVTILGREKLKLSFTWAFASK